MFTIHLALSKSKNYLTTPAYLKLGMIFQMA